MSNNCIRERLRRVIRSCKTESQLHYGLIYCEMLLKKYIKDPYRPLYVGESSRRTFSQEKRFKEYVYINAVQ